MGITTASLLYAKKCGRNANIVPIHYYENKIDEHPEKIDLELRCVCGNKYGATIHHSSVKLKTERIDK